MELDWPGCLQQLVEGRRALRLQRIKIYVREVPHLRRQRREEVEGAREGRPAQSRDGVGRGAEAHLARFDTEPLADFSAK